MFGIGTMEIIVILLVGVMVLGPEHLPKLVRTLTRVMSDVRRVSTDFQRTINLEVNAEDQRQADAAMKKKKKKKAAPSQKQEEPAPDTVDTVDTPDAVDTVVTASAGNAEEEMPSVYAAADTAPAQTGEEKASAADAPGDKA